MSDGYARPGATSFGRQHKWGKWSVGAIILAVIGTLIWTYVLLDHPSVTVLGHTIVVTQGLVAAALVVSAYFWAMIEVLTPAGESYLDLGLRFGLAVVIGSFIGGGVAYFTNVGAYVIVPALSGNYLALAMLVSTFFLSGVLLWGAAHAHTVTFVRGR